MATDPTGETDKTGVRSEGVIRVVVAEDQAMVRAGFSALLSAEPDMEVVGEAADGEQALELVRRLHPDVVVMDLRMPGVCGLEATGRITDDPTLAGTKVLVLTTFELDDYVFGALRAGASGFLLKGGRAAELPEAVRVVAQGEALLAPSVTRRLIREFVRRPETAALPLTDLDGLTAREREVLNLVAAGLNNTEIARELDLSPLTVKTHVARMRTKLGARDRAQLVVLAYQDQVLPE
jgi:DNA-binding NarL/FixJ family response regulator